MKHVSRGTAGDGGAYSPSHRGAGQVFKKTGRTDCPVENTEEECPAQYVTPTRRRRRRHSTHESNGVARRLNDLSERARYVNLYPFHHSPLCSSLDSQIFTSPPTALDSHFISQLSASSGPKETQILRTNTDASDLVELYKLET